MDKDYQSTNSIIKAATDNVMDKPKHEIKAEIRIEVTGEDEPTKYDKRRNRWGVAAVWSFLALLLSSVLFFTIAMNVYVLGISITSAIILGISISGATSIGNDEPTGPTPWYYGAI